MAAPNPIPNSSSPTTQSISYTQTNLPMAAIVVLGVIVLVALANTFLYKAIVIGLIGIIALRIMNGR